MRWNTEEQTQTRSRLNARHSGCSLTKCIPRHHKKQILNEQPNAASYWGVWAVVAGIARSGGMMSYYRAMQLKPWASVFRWALGKALLVVMLLWVPQFGVGFVIPPNTLCRNRLFLLMCPRHFPSVTDVVAPEEHGTCPVISIQLWIGRGESFPSLIKTLASLPLAKM